MLFTIDPSVERHVRLAPVTVTADDIRDFARAVGDLNPLYLDRQAARAAGYPDVIAPPMFCMRLRGGKMLPEVPLPAGSMSLHAGQEIEFHGEIVAGRTYTLSARVADVYEKTGRSGPMSIIVRETRIADTDGRLVASIRERQIVRSAETQL